MPVLLSISVYIFFEASCHPVWPSTTHCRQSTCSAG